MSIFEMALKAKKQQPLSEEERHLSKKELMILCIVEVADEKIRLEEEEMIYEIIDKITYNVADKNDLVAYYDDTLFRFKEIRSSGEDNFFKAIELMTYRGDFDKSLLNAVLNTAKEIATCDNEYHPAEKSIIGLWAEYIKE